MSVRVSERAAGPSHVFSYNLHQQLPRRCMQSEVCVVCNISIIDWALGDK